MLSKEQFSEEVLDPLYLAYMDALHKYIKGLDVNQLWPWDDLKAEQMHAEIEKIVIAKGADMIALKVGGIVVVAACAASKGGSA